MSEKQGSMKSRQTQCYWKTESSFFSPGHAYIQDQTVIEKSKEIKFWIRTD